jgi:hypothetical protein
MPTKEYRIPKRIENENTMSATLNDTNGEDPNPRTATKMPAQIKSKFGFSRSNKTIPQPKSNIVGGGGQQQQQQQRQHFQDISNNSGDSNGEHLNNSSRGSMMKHTTNGLPRDPRIRRQDGSISGGILYETGGRKVNTSNTNTTRGGHNIRAPSGPEDEDEPFEFAHTLDEEEMRQRTPVGATYRNTHPMFANGFGNQREQPYAPSSRDGSNSTMATSSFVVPEVLYWKDPARTMLHFFGGFVLMGTFYALSAAKASVFSHLAYAMSLVVMGKYVFAIAFPNAAKGITMNPEKMAIRARNMCYKFNAFTERHERFFAGRDNKATLGAFLALQMVKCVGGALSTRQLLFLAYIGAFTMPCAWEKQKVFVYEMYCKVQMAMQEKWAEFSPRTKVTSGVCGSVMVFKLASAQTRVNAVFLALVCYRIIKEQQSLRLHVQRMEDVVVGSVRRMSRSFVDMVSPVPKRFGARS